MVNMVEMGSSSAKEIIRTMKKMQNCNLLTVSRFTGIWSKVCLASIVSAMTDIYLFFEKCGAYVFTTITKWNGTSSINRYTRIRGEWYNLQSFEHPGGPVAISLAVGRDATALFESHHYFIDHDRLHRILSKYKVEKEIAGNLSTMDPRDDDTFFDWEEYDNSPFNKEIKTMVKDHFSKRARTLGITLTQATKATPTRWALVLSLMFLFLATIPSFVSGEYWTLIFTPFLAWVWSVNWWHDSLHFGLSCNWRVNAFLPYLFPLLSSPWDWYHQHVIGHHVYTNIGHRDPDVWINPIIILYHKANKSGLRYKSLIKFGIVFSSFSVAVPLYLNIIADLRANLTAWYNKKVAYRRCSGPRLVAHIFERCVVVAVSFIWPFFCFHLPKAIIWATLPMGIYSWLFMVHTQTNHLTNHTANMKDTNFLKHQVITAQNFGVGDCGVWGGLCFLLSGGLNYQIEHHLFPTVNHGHLPCLQPKVKAICKKHGIPYNEVNGYTEALNDFLIHFDNMGQTLIR